MAEHGGYTMYQREGCRCDACCDYASSRSQRHIVSRRVRRSASRIPKPRPVKVVAPVLDDSALPCRSAPDLWFSDNLADIDRAKRNCARCPIWQECRAWGLDHPDEWGVWGGLSARDRNRMRRREAA